MNVQPQFWRGIRQPTKEVRPVHVICPKCKERVDTVKQTSEGTYMCPYDGCGHVFKGDGILEED